MGQAAALELSLLVTGTAARSLWTTVADLLIALVPWVAWLTGRGRPAISELDRLWLDFRDRFGLVWGQRLREQFNRAVSHAGLPLELGWRGLQSGGNCHPPDAALAILLSLMKRFGPAPAEKEATEMTTLLDGVGTDAAKNHR